jgi:hypothetical protein
VDSVSVIKFSRNFPSAVVGVVDRGRGLPRAICCHHWQPGGDLQKGGRWGHGDQVPVLRNVARDFTVFCRRVTYVMTTITTVFIRPFHHTQVDYAWWCILLTWPKEPTLIHRSLLPLPLAHQKYENMKNMERKNYGVEKKSFKISPIV